MTRHLSRQTAILSQTDSPSSGTGTPQPLSSRLACCQRTRRTRDDAPGCRDWRRAPSLCRLPAAPCRGCRAACRCAARHSRRAACRRRATRRPAAPCRGQRREESRSHATLKRANALMHSQRMASIAPIVIGCNDYLAYGTIFTHAMFLPKIKLHVFFCQNSRRCLPGGGAPMIPPG